MSGRSDQGGALAAWDGETLTIGNAWLQYSLRSRPGFVCAPLAFVNKRTGRDYLRPGSAQFALSVDGRPFAGLDFEVERVEAFDGDPAQAVVHLVSANGALAVDLHHQVFARHPVLRSWLTVRNLGSTQVCLSDLDWLDLRLQVTAPLAAEVWSEHFTRRGKSVVVTMDECALLVHDAGVGEGFLLATEAPGPLKRLEAYAQSGRVAAGYNRDDETFFERTLDPGDGFSTPACFLLVYTSTIPQDVVDGPYADFVAQTCTHCDVGSVPSITVNTWVPHFTDLDRDLLLDQIEAAADLGVDAYQVDDGWYDHKGDWNADPAKFPNGLEEVADRARARGMRFGLWMAVATADESSRVLQEHPEWLARDRHGQPNRHPIPGAVTMCLDSGYYEHIRGKIAGAIQRYGVELLKLDLSTVRNVYAPGVHPGCFAEGHGHRSPGESHVRILDRLLALIQDLGARHPRCLMDLSYEAYGVVDGTDLALTKVADQCWFSNITTPNETSLRREIYERARVTRPWTLNYGGAVLNDPDTPTYGLFTALTGHGVFWGDLTDLDDEARETYRRWFAWVREQRARDDFYAHYRVSDVFPPPDGAAARDYRHAVPTGRYGVPSLGVHPPGFESETEHAGKTWDGVARISSRGEGPIFLFRPGACLSPYFTLRIPWLEAGVRYRLTDVNESRDLGVWEGARLAMEGLEVRLDEPRHAKVIVLRREGG